MFTSVAGTEVGKQQMSMRQTAKGVTLECPRSAAKLSTFLISVTASKSNTSGQVVWNTEENQYHC